MPSSQTNTQVYTPTLQHLLLRLVGSNNLHTHKYRTHLKLCVCACTPHIQSTLLELAGEITIVRATHTARTHQVHTCCSSLLGAIGFSSSTTAVDSIRRLRGICASMLMHATYIQDKGYTIRQLVYKCAGVHVDICKRVVGM